MSSDRYIRQVRLSSFGSEGQKSLDKTKVLIIGSGGLGCPVALYLSRAGVRRLGLVDADKVDLTNLHRQVLFNEADIGQFKVDAAKKNLLQGDARLEIETFNERLQSDNYERIIRSYDVVVDCSDNFETRYLVNDACILLDKPVVYGAANGWEGQVAVFNLDKSGNLRDIYPQIPTQGTIQNCEEAGVLGVTTGIVGSMMALEVIKVATHIGDPFINQLIQYDGESNQFHKLKYKAIRDSREVKINGVKQITWETYETAFSDAVLVDVRSTEERKAKYVESIHVPMVTVSDWLTTHIDNKRIVFFCETGQRALQASQMASTIGKNRAIAIVDTMK